MNTNTGGPAFPLSHSHKELEGTNWQHANGMTLRDYFAAKAMQALNYKYSNEDDVARHAYILADALLKARKA